MIVQCEQCQTRFRIPDEKVTDKGVRVRCTKCQHTFRVARPPAAAATEAAAHPSAPSPASPGVFDEPTRIGALSSEELARLGLNAPPPAARPPPAPAAARPTPPPVRRPAAAAPPADPLLDFGAPPAASPAEALRRAASPLPAPAGAVALSPTQVPAPRAAPPQAPGLDGQELFAGFGDVDLAPEPPAAARSAGPSLLGELGPPPEERASHPSDADRENARAMFDLPRREVIPPLPAAGPGAPAAPLELAIPLPLAADIGSPVAAIPRPSGRPEDVGISAPRSALQRARQALGALGNLLLAAVLVVGLAAVGRSYLKEGALELAALSPARLRDLLLPATPLALHDVGNGLYDTRDGRAVFFVRGEVENRTQAPARVRVRAALYDGEQRVKSAEGLAGATPSPEALHALTSLDEAAALRIRLDAKARVLAPGERAPFTLVFFEYPPALDAFRLELTPEAVAP